MKTVRMAERQKPGERQERNRFKRADRPSEFWILDSTFESEPDSDSESDSESELVS